ncbi:MAG: PH domain-containing protein [Candidatus Nanohalobium sp.]
MTELDWINLDDDEEVLWEGEPRMKSIIPAAIIGLITLPLAGLGVLIFLGAYLHLKNTSFVVTDQGLYKKTGILSRSVQKIGFDKVQNISFSQGIFGTQFNYGSIEISTAGGSGVEMRFNSINEPREVEQLINKHLKKEKREQKGETKGKDPVVEELQEIKGLLQEMNEKL